MQVLGEVKQSDHSVLMFYQCLEDHMKIFCRSFRILFKILWWKDCVCIYIQWKNVYFKISTHLFYRPVSEEGCSVASGRWYQSTGKPSPSPMLPRRGWSSTARGSRGWIRIAVVVNRRQPTVYKYVWLCIGMSCFCNKKTMLT